MSEEETADICMFKILKKNLIFFFLWIRIRSIMLGIRTTICLYWYRFVYIFKEKIL